MLERTRAVFELKAGEKCPGEKFCVEDPRGEINKRFNATLETHCNKECPFFFTNPRSTPLELIGYLEAACVLRERHQTGTELFENDLPFWAIIAYQTAERIYKQVDAESMNDGDENDGSQPLSTGTGDTPFFSLIREQFQERQGS